jgi:hypothetical protein
MTQKGKRYPEYALNVKLLGKGDNNAGYATHLKIVMRLDRKIYWYVVLTLSSCCTVSPAGHHSLVDILA